MRLHRDRAGRPQLQPKRRQGRSRRRRLAAESSGRPWPIVPAHCARMRDRCGFAAAGRADLIGDGLVDQRLDLRRDVDARAGHRKAGVAERDLGGQIGLEVPGRGELGPRGDGDVALDLGVGVECLDIHAADLLGDVAAEQTADARRRPRRSPSTTASPSHSAFRSAAWSATAHPGRRSPRSARARRSSRCRRFAGSATPGCRPCRRSCAARRARRRRGWRRAES